MNNNNQSDNNEKVNEESEASMNSKVKRENMLVSLPPCTILSPEILDSAITDALSFTPHISTALSNLDCQTINDLLCLTKTDFTKEKGIGAKAISIVRKEFEEVIINNKKDTRSAHPRADTIIDISSEETIPLWALNQPVEMLSITPGVLRALKAIGCSTLGDLKETTVADFLKQKGVGQKAIERIRVDFNNILVKTNPSIRPELKKAIGENYRYYPPLLDEITIPLDSKVDLPEMETIAVEASSTFLSHMQARWVNDDSASVDLRHRSFSSLMHEDNLAAKNLASEGIRSLSYPMSLFEQANSIEQLLVQCVVDAYPSIDQRSLEIYSKRNGLSGSILTLQEIADENGLTRERVRQIALKVETKISFSKSLRYFPVRLAICSAALDLGGSGHIKDLATRLEAHFFPNEKLISNIIQLSPDVETDKDTDSFWIINLPCNTCSSLNQSMTSLEGSMAAIDFSIFVNEVGCKTCSSGCRVSRQWISSHSSLDVADGIIGSVKNPIVRAALKPKSRRAAIQAVLFDAPGALSYDDIIHAVRERTGKNISKSLVGSQVQTFKDCLLWGRGTYIHERNAPNPISELTALADYSVEHFNKHNIPLLNVTGLYDQFESILAQAQVPNGQALYSLLRRMDDSRLELREYPWICDKHSITDRTTFAKYFYSVVESNNGFITDEHAQKIAEVTLAQSFALDGLAEYSPFLINANGGWYDIEAAEFDLQGVASLARDVANEMNDNDIVSAKKVFEQYRERCSSYGVKSYDLLYYLVDMMEDDLPLEASRKPHFIKAEKKHMSVLDAVRKYIDDSPTPISKSDIEEEFRIKRGINTAGICARLLVSDNNLVVVGDNLFWTRKHLQIDDDYISRFDAVVAEALCGSNKLAGAFYRRSSVLPNYSTLPSPGSITWNTELLKAVFSKSSRFLLLGETFECIVDQKSNPEISNAETFYVSILKKNFHGWSPFDSFKTFCNSYSIRSNLQPEFFDAFTLIEADEISIQIN